MNATTVRICLLILAASGALLVAACQPADTGSQDQPLRGPYVGGGGGVGFRQ